MCGNTSDAVFIEEIHGKLASRDVRVMAQAMLDIMPGSETYANMISTRAMLQRCIDGTLLRDESEDMVYRAIVFRYQYLRLADDIIIHTHLPQAGSKKAMMWNEMEWKAASWRDHKLRRKFVEYIRKLKEVGFYIKAAKAQYSEEFSRPMHYVAACFIEAGLDDEDVDKRIQVIADYMKEDNHLAQGEILLG